ncbi:MAG: phosphomannose isomerase type II C-terminal cupin domain [Planctomycetota bacterium]|jgi:mannose-6-phosphate isomerase-like protein (cupin superfamily)
MAAQEDHRPWGFYSILHEDPVHKVKRIVVFPGKRLSLQRHRRRSEHWVVVQGTGKVTLDHDEISVARGESVDISQGAKHRMENCGPEDLIFIEIQTGDYFGEDDIERFEDDFDRA